ncbi:MAG: nucleotidyl transferase AbiEii/AbiGii toxin family protein [Bacteroidales bacterium]|nr:nucleotidyl transferase AbiEii/AbiGii toxin family protein [Bacteroidales bacterium]
MIEKLHLDILPEEQLKLFETLSVRSFIKDFYLAGGTCLALQIGHRQSIDFDFFIPDDFNTSAVIARLTQAGNYERENEEKNTINGRLNQVRISFFGYKYRIIDSFKIFNNIRLAGMKDIAAMKLEAIAGRGSKKDFIDLFFLLKEFTLKEIFTFHTEKYGTGLSNHYHHLKSLVYFTDAEAEVMPVLIHPLDWEDVKEKIISVVKGYRII